MRKIYKKQVVVAVSGGVDSSVAAYMLKKQGYEVAGIYLRLFDDAQKEKQVRKIAKAIGIPLFIKDVKKEFKKTVIGYFLNEYKNGRTPNPCIVCNREIKFKFLFRELAKSKADFVATGHYVCAREIKNQKSRIKNYRLFEARDKSKDQSYFLYTLSQKQLARIIFPLGDYKKEEIKKLAKKLKLPVDSEESQNVCFISAKNPDNFLKDNLKLKTGDIIDKKGKVLGQHQGLALYTLGQRRGINLGGCGPYYVVEKKYSKNQLMVTNDPQDQALSKNETNLKSINWVSKKPKLPAKLLVRNRYHDPLSGAIIKLEKGKYHIKFSYPQRAVTAGQSAVFYSRRGEVIGGGIIA